MSDDTAPSSGATTEVQDFRLAVPANWLTVDLDARTSRRSIARLVEERAGSHPETAESRRQLTQMLQTAAEDAIEQGAVYAAILSTVIAERPVSASLICTVTTSPEPVEVDQVASELRRPHTSPSVPLEVEVVDLPVGRAVRTRGRRIGEMPAPVLRRVEVESLQYFVPVPGAKRLLLLSFSTPNLPIADALVELFDAIAATLRWEAS